MQFAIYLLFRLFIGFIYLLPFSFLYKIADVLYFLFFHILKYRKNIIFGNLRASFPKKNEEEIQQIAKKFYQHFADLLVEGVKGFAMSKEELLKRYKAVDVEILDHYFQKKQPIVAMGGHYGNWEWGVMCVGLQFQHKAIGIYKRLANRYIDAYLCRSREQFNMNLVHLRETKQAFEQEKNETAVYIMMSDQSPRTPRQAHWVNFLNQRTACLHGAEKYARQYNYPIVLYSVQRVKRGYYTFKVKELCTDSSSKKKGEITALFMRELEQIILEEPAYWLWSHKRWKF